MIKKDNERKDVIQTKRNGSRQKPSEAEEQALQDVNRRDNERKDVIQTKRNGSRHKPNGTEEQALQDVKKKGQNAHRTQLLELAMDWNCIAVAKELILKNSLGNILVRNFRRRTTGVILDFDPLQKDAYRETEYSRSN